jgi:hypothetical protein
LFFVSEITNKCTTCCTAAASICFGQPKFPAFTLGLEVGYLTLVVILSRNKDSRPALIWDMTALSQIFFNSLFTTKPVFGCW